MTSKRQFFYVYEIVTKRDYDQVDNIQYNVIIYKDNLYQNKIQFLKKALRSYNCLSKLQQCYERLLKV